VAKGQCGEAKVIGSDITIAPQKLLPRPDGGVPLTVGTPS